MREPCNEKLAIFKILFATEMKKINGNLSQILDTCRTWVLQELFQKISCPWESGIRGIDEKFSFVESF